MTLADAARTIAANARAIPDALGLRIYSVSLRVETLEDGTWTAEDTELSPRPRVIPIPVDAPAWATADQLLSRGGRAGVQAVYEIVPFTPTSATATAGQYDPSDLLTPDGDGPSTTRRVRIVLTGPDTPETGAVCQVVAIDTSRALRWSLIVARTTPGAVPA